ncbi:MAG: VOC family protein [Pseudomonas sp.]|uniref:VOC family protein n=1 Tax=Pseudomonas sp. TaxID=306 RepID=UPI0033912398
MTDPNMTILYVDSPVASAAFYSELLDKTPVEASPTFALFVLHSGSQLGLWSRHTVEPAATVGAGGGELAFSVSDNDQVQALHDAWRARGLVIAQAPTTLDFGHTFVALDPDGHRLRVYALSEG